MSAEARQSVLQIIQLVCEEKTSQIGVLQEIKGETHLRNDLGLDSLELAELTVRLEDAFQIDIFEEGVVETVDEVFQRLSL